jgi:hypothetical protein
MPLETSLVKIKLVDILLIGRKNIAPKNVQTYSKEVGFVFET